MMIFICTNADSKITRDSSTSSFISLVYGKNIGRTYISNTNGIKNIVRDFLNINCLFLYCGSDTNTENDAVKRYDPETVLRLT